MVKNMILKTLNDAENRKNEINELINEETRLLQLALIQKNLKKRYQLYNQARVLRRIKEECIKWETMTNGF